MQAARANIFQAWPFLQGIIFDGNKCFQAAQECLRTLIDIWVELTIDLSLKPSGYLSVCS